MSSTIRNLLIKWGTDFTGLQKGLKQASRDLSRAGRNMQRTGRTLTKSLTVPMLAAGTAAAKFSMDYEDSLAKVGTITDTNVKSLDVLGNEVISLSNKTGTAATEINETLYQAISAGADTADAMGLVEVAVKAAKGGFTDAATAVDGLTSVLNSYNMETGKAKELSNKFFVAQKKGRTTFAELAQSIGSVAPLASTTGVSVDTLLSSIVSLTASGQSTAEAVTGVRSALTNVIKPTAEAAEEAKRLGIDFSASALKSKGFVAFLKDIKEKTGGNAESMAKLFGNVRALNAVASLTSDGGMAKLSDALEEMETNTTAADDAFNTMNNTAGNKLRKALNQLKNAGIKLGQSLLPIITDKIVPAVEGFAGAISKLLDKFNGMSSAGQKFTMLGLGIVASLGPVVTISGKAASGLALIAKQMAAASAATAAGKGAVTAFLGATGTLSVALIALTAVIGGTVIVYRELTKEEREYKKSVDELVGSTKRLKKANEDEIKELGINKKLTKELTDELYQLNAKEEKSTDDKDRMRFIVKKLNDMYKDLNLSIDEATGLLKDETGAIEDVIEAKQKQMEYLAYQEQEIDYRKEQIRLEEELEAAARKIADAYGVQREEIDDTFVAIEQYSWRGLYGGVGKVLDAYDELKDAIKENGIALENTQEKFKELSVSVETDSESMTSAMGLTTEEMQTMVDAVVLGSGEITNATKLSQEAFAEELAETAGNIKLTQEEINEMYEMYGTTYTEATADYEKYIQDLESKTRQHYNSMGGLFDEFTTNQEISKEDLLRILREQVEGFKGWDEDLDGIAVRVGKDGKKIVDDGLIAELRTMGPKAAGEVKALSEMTDPELVEYVELWREKNKLAETAAMEELGPIVDDTEDVLTEMKGVLGNSGGIKMSARNLGSTMTAGIQAGINSRVGALITSARAAAQKALTAMKAVIRPGSPSKVTTEYGKAIADGITLGIDKRSKYAIRSASILAAGTMANFQPNALRPALSMAGGASSGGLRSSGGISVNVNIGGPVVGDRDFGDMVGNAIVQKLQSMGIRE